MPVPSSTGDPSNYLSGLVGVVRLSLTQLVRPSLPERRPEAARRLTRETSLLAVVVGVAIVVLMYFVDAAEISLMPPRGTPSLWPFGVVTDFGKAAFVLWPLAAMLIAVALVAPALRETSKSRLLSFGIRLQFLFFAVLVPILAGEVVKWIVGRGRPFVGGKANAFNFVHFAGTQAYASFPSAHSITAFALAFAVSAVWPRARVAMMIYAVAIAGSRLVLLAHHPSDVVAGALFGVVGAMAVRYWFAVRRLGFAISGDGEIVPLSRH